MTRLLTRPALEVGPLLLGSVFRVGEVAVRLTEVEAYHGQGQDPGSHAHRGPTPRNSSMFREGGTLYVYLSYGIHRCVNIVCGPEGYVRDRIEAFREAGVTMLNVTPVGPEPARLISTVKNWLQGA